mgnify:FL=1
MTPSGQQAKRNFKPEIAPPMSSGDAAGWEKFVECWQDRVYALAVRVLRNRTSAADATQEIFLTLWRRRDRYDRSRPLKPWLYRVAMNSLRVELRRDRNQRKREREAAVTDVGTFEGDRLEAEERRRIVGGQLDEMPAETRALPLLHYQHGLSQREIARTLGLRRSTVQDRLTRALDSLRGSLRRGGHLALIPVLEATIGNTKLDAAPPLLTESLLAVPQTAAAVTVVGTTGWALTVGGLTMAKFGPAALICVAVLSLAVGLGAGGMLGSGSADDGSGERLAELEVRFADLETEHGKTASERDTLTAALDATQLERADLRTRLESLRGKLALAKSESATPDEVESAALEAIDWTALATAFEDNTELFLWVGDLLASGLDPRTELPREERERFTALQKLWDSAAAIARRDSIHPFLEPDVLIPLLSAVLAGPLGLDARQSASLEAESARLLAEWPGAAEGTPLEAWQARQAILGGMRGTLEGMLGPEQAESWGHYKPVSDYLLGGSQRNFSIGVGDSEDIPTRARDEWTQHYKILPEQQDRFESTLTDYNRAIREIMAETLGASGSINDLPAKDQERLRQRYLDQQLRAEQQILKFLDEDQIAQLRERLPDIWVFEPGGSTSINFNHNDGF